MIKKHLTASPEVYNLITVECVKEFLKHHPEFEGMNISQDFILRKIAIYYLGI